MRAVILAAGRGSRLMPHTDETPKGLLSLGDTTIVQRTIDLLHRLRICEVSIVVGYRKHKFLDAYPTGVRFYVNDDFLTTDQGASLLAAWDDCNDDVLVITSDLVCSESVLDEVTRNQSAVCIAVDQRPRVYDDAIEKVLITNGEIVKIGKTNVDNDEANAEFLGLTKFRREVCEEARQRLAMLLRENPRSAIVHLHQDLLDSGTSVGYVECRGEWCEIDDIASLEKARRIVASAAVG